jgi:hypothetical protein
MRDRSVSAGSRRGKANDQVILATDETRIEHGSEEYQRLIAEVLR